MIAETTLFFCIFGGFIGFMVFVIYLLWGYISIVLYFGIN